MVRKIMEMKEVGRKIVEYEKFRLLVNKEKDFKQY